MQNREVVKAKGLNPPKPPFVKVIIDLANPYVYDRIMS
jgi:hypothetical protein